MAIESDIQDLEREILEAIGGYTDTIPKQLAALVSDIQSQLKAGHFKNRTGNLRRSMRAALIDDSVSISMRGYGYFLSFGVNGKKRKNALGLPNEVATAFGVPEGYKFGQGSDKVWGINPYKFYPLDIEDRLIEILTQEDI
jgi:hypothetical protein